MKLQTENKISELSLKCFHELPEHLETYFLLAMLKIPVKESHDYSKEIELLENS